MGAMPVQKTWPMAMAWTLKDSMDSIAPAIPSTIPPTMTTAQAVVATVGNFTLLAMVVGLLIIAVMAGRRGWSDLVAWPILQTQSSWQQTFASTGGKPTTEQWQSQHEKLALSQRLDPENPMWMEWMAQLYGLAPTVQTVTANGSANPIVGAMVSIVTEQTRAVIARPVSPYSWAAVAWSKYQAGQVDAAFYASLANAAKLGPWEPEVQFVVIDLGFALWDEMPNSLQPTIRQMAINAERRYPDQVIAIATRRGRLNVVCDSEKLANMKVCLANGASLGA